MNSNNNEHEIAPQLLTLVEQLLAESGEENSRRRITLHSSLQRHLGIDSLGRAELFQRIEKLFSVRLQHNVIAEAETIQDIVTAISAPSLLNAQPHVQPAPQVYVTKIHIDPSSEKTLIDTLLLYATQDPAREHIYLQDENGKEEVITYGKLFELAKRVANALQKRGLQPGDTVAIMQPTNPGFFYTFFGILLAGCVPVPIYPPLRPQQIEAYAKQEAKILRNAEVRILVTFQEAENLSHILRAFIPSLKEVTTTNVLLESGQEPPTIFKATADDFALIQYTSGSTNAPKGVLLSHQNLLANIRAYGKAINITPQDVVVSWLPLYHDLGLIGSWLGSLYHGVPLTLLSPLTFLNRPERWLWAIHYHRATISAGPNFAYELCVRKIDPASIEGLDLSSWRFSANGAEAVQPKTLQRFAEKFAPYGLKPTTVLPVYGLAETCVGLTAPPMGRLPRIDIIKRHEFEKNHQAIPVTASNNTLEFVSCGMPLPNHEVRIVDKTNTPLAERYVGHLQFKGPSSMQGYYGNPEATQAIYHDGWIDTGDLAYQADKEIFITGRKKDVIIKAGRNLYPAEIEELTSEVTGIRQGCVVAFGTTDAQRGTERLIVVAETREKKLKIREQIIAEVIEKISTTLAIAPDQVILVAPRSIPKTSSGKLQRSACKIAYLEGKLSNRGLPAWLQFTKLSIQWARVKMYNAVSYISKILYSSYVGVLLLLTLPPAYLSLFIFPRDIAARICQLWARTISTLAFCPVFVTGKENLRNAQPLIFAANHASYIDVFILMSILPIETRFVGKKQLLDAAIIGTFMKKLGHLSVDRDNSPKGIEDTRQMQHSLQQKNSILIFPEGTFRYAEGLRPFKLGTFKIAAETATPVCPIGIHGTRHILRGEELILKPGIIKVTIGTLIKPDGIDWQNINQLRSKVRAEVARYCGEVTLDLIVSTLPSASKPN